MPRKYAVSYIDELLAGATYDELVRLTSAVRSSAHFNPAAADYGLPRFAFLMEETLIWFAISVRSGVNNYYEATSSVRQEAMLAALRADAPLGFAFWYERGRRHRRNKWIIAAVDYWIEKHDDAANRWLRALARKNREALLELT
jgi:hypothetical protein